MIKPFIKIINMKKFENKSKALTRNEMKAVTGGYGLPGPGNCISAGAVCDPYHAAGRSCCAGSACVANPGGVLYCDSHIES